jgi:hypothetical protein
MNENTISCGHLSQGDTPLVAISEDPRSLGKPLKGVRREFWRYRSVTTGS